MTANDTATADDDVSRREFLQSTGAAASAAAVAGLGGAAVSSAAAQEGEQLPDATLRLTNSTMTTLDPIAATDTASGVVIQQLFDALTNYPNGEPTPENLLATDVQISDDALTYTFSLVEGATFHNGDPVRAQDFVYAFERLAGSANSRRTAFILDDLAIVHETDGDGNYQPGTLAVEAVDDTTLEFTLDSPFHAALELLAYTAFAALPEGIVGDVEGYEGDIEYNEFATSNPVGAGPFQFENWSQGTDAAVTRYDDYYGDVATIGGVRWQIIEDDSALFNFAMNRNADVFPIPTTQFDPTLVSVEETDDQGREFGTYGPMRNGLTANLVRVPTINSFYVGFNMAVVPKPVRQAFAYVMNQGMMVDQVFKGRGQGAFHFTPPAIYPGGAEAYQAHVEEAYPYGINETQLDQARQVMEDAGFGPNDRFQLNWTQYQSDTWLEMAQILRDQLTSAHIDMQIEQAPFATLLQRGREGNLEAYTLGWIADWPTPDNFLQLLNPPQTDTQLSAPISYTNWNSETGDAAEQATTAFESIRENSGPGEEAEQARADAAVEIEEANWEDVSFQMVYHQVGDRFWYDWTDIAAPGGMGGSRQKRNRVTISSSPDRPE